VLTTQHVILPGSTNGNAAARELYDTDYLRKHNAERVVLADAVDGINDVLEEVRYALHDGGD
jgi:hypothetical protein